MSLSFTSSAEWVGGVQLFNLHSEDGDFEADVQGLALSLGRHLNIINKVYIVPELRLGIGLSSDTLQIIGTDLDIELDQLFSFSARTYYQLTESLHLFAMPTYTNTEFTVSTSIFGADLSRTEDDWDLGLGLGASYAFDEKVSGDLIFEYYDGKTMLGLGARFSL